MTSLRTCSFRYAIICTLATCFVVASGASSALAWHPETTHAGITQKSAVPSAVPFSNSSHLHTSLQNQLGFDNGLLTALTLQEAPTVLSLTTLQKLLTRAFAADPSAGFRPSNTGPHSGRMTALGWLIFGATLQAMPIPSPASDSDSQGSVAQTPDKTKQPNNQAIASALRRASLATRSFHHHWNLALTKRSWVNRTTAAALALVAAGQVLHIVQEMGDPTIVRQKKSSSLQRLGFKKNISLLGKMAMRAFGRLGVPKYVGPRINIDSVTSAISNSQGTGIADITQRSWFSTSTMPKAISLSPYQQTDEAFAQKLAASLQIPFPAPPTDLDLLAARNTSARLENDKGVCLAMYQVVKHQLQWFSPDRCLLEQSAALLKTTVAYSTAVLQHLFSSPIVSLRTEKDIHIIHLATNVNIVEAKVSVYWDNKDKQRSLLTTQSSAHAESVLSIKAPIPKQATAITFVLHGKRHDGSPIAAGLYTKLSK